MGPPSEPPNVLRISAPGLFGSPLLNSAAFRKVSFATAAAFLLYSYALPWRLFVPLLVTRTTCAPDDRPSSALELVVVTRNSSTESKVERNTPLKAYPCRWSLLSTPSKVTLDWSERAPATAPLRLSKSGLT